jgi:hypothetical protein
MTGWAQHQYRHFCGSRSNEVSWDSGPPKSARLISLRAKAPCEPPKTFLDFR